VERISDVAVNGREEIPIAHRRNGDHRNGGSLTVSSPAHAGPMLPLPLAPACSQWGFPGVFTLKQTNADAVRFNSTGPVASGLAVADTPNGRLTGPVSGGITADNLDFTIRWSGSPDNPVGHYTGSVGSDGFAHGDTYDQSSPASALWDSTVPLVCTTPAASAPAPASAPAGTTAGSPRCANSCRPFGCRRLWPDNVARWPERNLHRKRQQSGGCQRAGRAVHQLQRQLAADRPARALRRF
jgi:hypothetical protein